MESNIQLSNIEPSDEISQWKKNQIEMLENLQWLGEEENDGRTISFSIQKDTE